MNKENLLKLATYLLSEKLTAEFDMSAYTENVEDSDLLTSCGSVGCAVGHGPYAGIPKKYYESWQGYAYRAFGTDILEAQFNWMFSAMWKDGDNTPEGAAKRILYLIRHGLPNDAVAQMFGFEPLCYLNEKL